MPPCVTSGPEIGIVKTWVLVLVPLIVDKAVFKQDPLLCRDLLPYPKRDLMVPAHLPGLVRRSDEVKSTGML